MRKSLLVASALSLLPIIAPRADGFDIHQWYDKAKELAQSLNAATPPQHGNARVPAEGIDPKMALVPSGEARMRIIPPPGSTGGDRRFDPR